MHDLRRRGKKRGGSDHICDRKASNASLRRPLEQRVVNAVGASEVFVVERQRGVGECCGME